MQNRTLPEIDRVCQRYLASTEYALIPKNNDEVEVRLYRRLGINLWDENFNVGDIRANGDTVIFDVRLKNLPKPKGYCQRVRDYLAERGIVNYRIIDYPIDETVTVKFPVSKTGQIVFDQELLRDKIEIRMLKVLKDGSRLVSYHFND